MYHNTIAEKFKNAPQTKTNKKIAQYIIDNENKVLFMNTVDLANAVQASDASILRFVRSIGYDNFNDLKNDLKTMILERSYKPDNIIQSPVEKYLSRLNQDSDKVSEMEQVVRGAYLNIQKLIYKNPEEKFEKIVEIILASRKSFIVGFRENAGTVQRFSDFLGIIKDDVIAVTEFDHRGMNKLLEIGKEDCMVIFSFKRYSNPAFDFLDVAKEAGAKIVAITDMETSPFALEADCSIICSKESNSFFGSSIAQTAVIEILLSKAAAKNKEAFSGKWKKLDDYLVRRGIY